MATEPVTRDGQVARATERDGTGRDRASGRRRPRTERSEESDGTLELGPPRGRLDVVA